MAPAGGRIEAKASAESGGPEPMTVQFKVHLEFEELRCLLGSSTEWVGEDSFFVVTTDPVEPGHSCRFELGVTRRGPWIEGEGEVTRAARLSADGQATGMEIAVRELSEGGTALWQQLRETWLEGGASAVAELAAELAAQLAIEVPTEAMPAAPSDGVGEDTAELDETVPLETAPAETTGGVREATLVLDDPRPAPPVEASGGPSEDTASVSGKSAKWIVTAILIGLAAVAGIAWWLLGFRMGIGASELEVSADPIDLAEASDPGTPSMAGEVSPWVRLRGVRWVPVEGGMEVELETDHPVDESGFRSYRLDVDGAPPRELVKIFGAVQDFDERFLRVGGAYLSQIRTGSHYIDGIDELHIVFDVARPEIRLLSVEAAPSGLVVRFGVPAEPANTASAERR